MINALVLALAFGLLVLQGMVQQIIEWIAGAGGIRGEWFYPSFVLPIVLTMSVGEFSLARGVSLAWVIGYLSDSFSVLPMGLYTFSLTAVFLLARVAGLKLFLHGAVFQILLTFFASIVMNVLMMGLLVVFERTHLAMGPALLLVTSQSVATALLAPAVFALVRKLPGAETPKPEEATSV